MVRSCIPCPMYRCRHLSGVLFLGKITALTMFSPAGDGMAARQRAIIGGRINDGALFPNIFFSITEKIGVIAEVEQGELRGATRDVVAQIRRDTDLVLMAPREQEVRSAETVRQLMGLAEVVEGLRVDVRGIGEALEVDGS